MLLFTCCVFVFVWRVVCVVCCVLCVCVVCCVLCLCRVWCVLCAVCCAVCCVLFVWCLGRTSAEPPKISIFFSLPLNMSIVFCSLGCLVVKLWCLEIWLIREAGTSHHECHGSRLRLVGTTSTQWPTPVPDSEMLWQMAEEFVGAEVLEVVQGIRGPRTEVSWEVSG